MTRINIRDVRRDPRLAFLSTTLGCLAAFVVITGCDGTSGPGADFDLTDEPAGTNLSGIDMSGYSQAGQPTPAGGFVQLPDGTGIQVSPGLSDGSIIIGLRPSADGPVAGNDVQGIALTPWIDAAVSTSNFDATRDAPFLIQVPVTPPDGSIDHPGLQLTLVLPDGSTFPINGTFDSGFGVFNAALLALPPSFQFAVTFNEAITRIDSADVPELVSGQFAQSALTEGPWSTTEFVIDFDGNKVTMEQARKVARAARRAAATYSAAGFGEPFLFKETGILGERWHIHLTAKGSCFDSNHDSAAEDISRRFGRLFVSTARIDSPTTDNLGSVYASIAHEMFHSIFFNYRIPYVCFNYVKDGTTYCHRSYDGFNEGMATAIGYSLDQGQVKPRPNEAPNPLAVPIGYFNANERWVSYRNQDFFVFLLRIASLSNVEKMLRTLQTATMPASPTNTMACLTAYGNALEAGGVGQDIGFTEMLGGYVANRGFIREPEGHIWPAEPSGGQPGEMYALDRTLFDTIRFDVDERDCNYDFDTDEIECTATLPAVNPMSGALFSIGFKSIADDWELLVDSLTVSAVSTGGSTAFWLAGEKNGRGEEGGVVSAMSPASAILITDPLWTNAHILAAQGPEKGDIAVTITMAARSPGLTFEGTGVVIDTFTPSGGQPGVCTQYLPMRLEVEHLPGWVDLTYTSHDVQMSFSGSDGVCTLLDTTWNESLYNTEHPEGSFAIGSSPSTGYWVTGTYNQETASGRGTTTYGDYSREVQFDLNRVR